MTPQCVTDRGLCGSAAREHREVHGRGTAMQLTRARDLGARIRERRRQLGLSQADLARLTRTTRQWVIALERGKTTVSLDHVLRTLEALRLVADIQPTEEPDTRPRMREATVPDTSIVEAVLNRAKRSRRPTKAKIRAVGGKDPVAHVQQNQPIGKHPGKHRKIDYAAALEQLRNTHLLRRSETETAKDSIARSKDVHGSARKNGRKKGL